MSSLKGTLGVVRVPVDGSHPLTAAYTSLAWNDISIKFIEALPPLGPQENEETQDSQVYKLVESVVRPVQNVAAKVLRER